MQSLKEQLGAGAKREAVIADAGQVLDQEVNDKGGLTGIAIKGAYKVVKGIKPGFIREVIDALLDEFLDALDPFYQEAAAGKHPAGAIIRKDASRAANALLSVTDRRAQKTKSQTIKGAYDKLRAIAQKQVEAACPRLAALVERHAEPTS